MRFCNEEKNDIVMGVSDRYLTFTQHFYPNVKCTKVFTGIVNLQFDNIIADVDWLQFRVDEDNYCLEYLSITFETFWASIQRFAWLKFHLLKENTTNSLVDLS